MGGMWLEAFSGDVKDGLPNGVGTTKFAEHAFVELDESAMVNPVRPSAVAAYLHDGEENQDSGAAQSIYFATTGNALFNVVVHRRISRL
jgi:hypothetical protein